MHFGWAHACAMGRSLRGSQRAAESSASLLCSGAIAAVQRGSSSPGPALVSMFGPRITPIGAGSPGWPGPRSARRRRGTARHRHRCGVGRRAGARCETPLGCGAVCVCANMHGGVRVGRPFLSETCGGGSPPAGARRGALQRGCGAHLQLQPPVLSTAAAGMGERRRYSNGGGRSPTPGGAGLASAPLLPPPSSPQLVPVLSTITGVGSGYCITARETCSGSRGTRIVWHRARRKPTVN